MRGISPDISFSLDMWKPNPDVALMVHPLLRGSGALTTGRPGARRGIKC